MAWKYIEDKRAYQKAHIQIPEVRDRINEMRRINRKRPEVRAREKAYEQEYSHRPEVKAREKANAQKPEVNARINSYNREYSKRPEVKARNKANRFYKQRLPCIEHYGGKCVCCGETEIAFLALDHVNNDGVTQRKHMRGATFYRWLKENNYPDTFQLLCHNCNWAKHTLGRCPHWKDGVPPPSFKLPNNPPKNNINEG